MNGIAGKMIGGTARKTPTKAPSKRKRKVNTVGKPKMGGSGGLLGKGSLTSRVSGAMRNQATQRQAKSLQKRTKNRGSFRTR